MFKIVFLKVNLSKYPALRLESPTNIYYIKKKENLDRLRYQIDRWTREARVVMHNKSTNFFNHAAAL